MDLLIWWLCQEDCERIAVLDEVIDEEESRKIAGLPEYINTEFWSRYGRSGRGRLWINNSLGLPRDFSIDWSADSIGARKLTHFNYGGIVIRAEHKALVLGLPGVVTDLQLRIVGE